MIRVVEREKVLVKASSLSGSESKEFPRGKFPTQPKSHGGVVPKTDSADDCVRFDKTVGCTVSFGM